LINEIITSHSKYNKKVLSNHPYIKDAIAKGDIMVTHSPAYEEYENRVVHLFDGHIITENMQGKFHI